MPLWLFMVVLASGFLAIGVFIDYNYKKNERFIDTKRLSRETKDNFGNSSSFM
ncbi:hypothetical protein [Cytobacillus praedii]|uniref:hypothetical protein n=1 Tax=Cytobacillus praedii TaxID=1742358 RepID=UPI0013F3F0B6|nr:hypothetical protein [Cytobacillus praedii]